MSTRVRTRTRVNITRTEKSGYIPDTTVEYEWDGLGVGEEQDADALYQLGILLKEVRLIAFKECDERNRMEGRASIWDRVDRSTGEIIR